MDPVLTLPCEILTNILSFLTPLDLCKCSLLSSFWNEASNSDYVCFPFLKQNLVI